MSVSYGTARKCAPNKEDEVKKAVVDWVVNDRWIATLVGKVTGKLEEARGMPGVLGYSG
jgi:hypothetical protein